MIHVIFRASWSFLFEISIFFNEGFNYFRLIELQSFFFFQISPINVSTLNNSDSHLIKSLSFQNCILSL